MGSGFGSLAVLLFAVPERACFRFIFVLFSLDC